MDPTQINVEVEINEPQQCSEWVPVLKSAPEMPPLPYRYITSITPENHTHIQRLFVTAKEEKYRTPHRYTSTRYLRDPTKLQGKTYTGNHKMEQTKGISAWNVPHLLSFRLQRAHRQPSCRAVNFCTSDFGTFFVKSCSGATSGWYSHNFILKYCTDGTTSLHCSHSA